MLIKLHQQTDYDKSAFTEIWINPDKIETMRKEQDGMTTIYTNDFSGWKNIRETPEQICTAIWQNEYELRVAINGAR